MKKKKKKLIDFESLKESVCSLPGKVVRGVKVTGQVIWENKELLMLATTAGAAIIETGLTIFEAKSQGKVITAQRDDRLCRFQDPITGDWTYTTRPLNKKERKAYEERTRDNEESTFKVLDEMGLIE